MLAKEFHVRRPFTVKRLPFLASLYCKAYHRSAPGWRLRASRLFFSLYYSLCRSATGEFEYERAGKCQTIRFNARNLQFQALYAPFFRYGYEPDVALLLDALLPEGGTFFDIGSNWGYFPLYAASNRNQLTIHAFEPMPATFHDLTECVAQAGLSQMVACHRMALSSTDGEAPVRLPDGLHSGQAMLSDNGGTMVTTKRLDGLNLAAPDFIKMDVEGHEIEVLRGGTNAIATARPYLVFENKPFGDASERTLEPLFFLKALGYHLYAPVIQRRTEKGSFYVPTGGRSEKSGDLLVLMPLEPEMRLLWQNDLNVLACHESRLSRLAAIFNV